MKKILHLLKPLSLAIVAAVVSLALPVGAQSVWFGTNNVSTDTNWSSSVNWLPAGVPNAFSNVLFNDSGTVSGTGTPNNVVDSSTTILQLAYRQTNGVHNTLILPGVTLTVSNTVAATNFIAGTDNTNAAYSTLVVNNTISGARGTLTIINTNVASVICVREINNVAGAHSSVLDMSGLDNFNATIGKVWVGVYPTTGPTRPQGVLYLAKTNNITAVTGGTKLAPGIDVGDTFSSPNVGNYLELGISNNIAADTIVVGNERSGGNLIFNAAFTNLNASLYLRGYTNSTSRVSVFNIGDDSSATATIGSPATGIVDFTGGKIDAMVDSMSIGNGQAIGGTGAGTATGTLTMNIGNLNVNTLEVGHQNINTTPATATTTGTVNVNGGTLTVNTSMRLGYWNGAGAQSSGTLDLQDSGTVQANSIVAGGGNVAAVNLFSGTLIVSNTMGSAASPLSSFTVNQDVTAPILQFSVASGVTPCEVKSFSSDNSGVINIASLPPIPQYPSQFPLIAYQSGGSGVTFAMGTLPGTVKGYISNDNSGTIYVVITNGPSLASVTWGGGVNNLWDTSTLNWTNTSAATVAYADPDVVTFNDSAKTNKVNVTGTFAPAGWLQNNNTKNYTFSGIGNIVGPGSLVMNGTNSVTLSESGLDGFSGGILANAGTVVLDNNVNSTNSGGLAIASGATVQIGNNDANGVLPTGVVDDEGTLAFNRTDNFILSTAIPGGGVLAQIGSGTLTLNAVNLYSGNTIVTAGRLALTNSGSIASSANVNVTGATLDVSGATNLTTLLNLNLTNAALTVSVGYPQTNLNVSSLSMGGTGNTLNVSSLPPIVVYPTTVTILKSANPISSINMSVGSLPAGYAGTVVALSGDSTAVLLTLTSGPTGVRSGVTWVGVDAIGNVSTNWSDNNNWQLPGAPTNVDNVLFNNSASTTNSALSTPGGGASALIPANVNNIVDRNFTIASLTYTNKGGTYHNTYITNGATLTITNFLTVGGFDSATLQQEYVNIAGGPGATLNVNNHSNNFQVWIGDSATAASFASLDMSALDNFTATINQLVVGATVGNVVNRPSGILYLAKTNTIIAGFTTTNDVEAGSTTATTAIIVGDCNQNQGPTNVVYLGRANTFSADTIAIARQKDSSSMLFNTNYANIAPYPVVTFAGYSTSLVSNFDIGDGAGNTGTTAGTGDLNLTGGFVTASVDTMNVGRASAGATGVGTTTGTLEFDAGTITANTVNVGLESAAGTKVGVGTVSVNTNTVIGNSAHLVVNGSLNLGVNVDNAVVGTSGTLNINGGTVQASTIVAGVNAAPSTINLNSGMLNVTGTAGAPGAPLTTLALAGGTVQLSVNGSINVTNIVATTVTTNGTTILKIGSLASVATGVTYPLIRYTGTAPSFGGPALPAGYTGVLTNITASSIVALRLTTLPSAAQPVHITSIHASGTTLNVTATNGVIGGQYYLLGTTNVAQPLSQWIRILTNNFDGSGNLNLSTNIINPAVRQQFYDIVQP